MRTENKLSRLTVCAMLGAMYISGCGAQSTATPTIPGARGSDSSRIVDGESSVMPPADELLIFDGETAVMPPDIDPVSLMRLPLVEREALDAEGRRVYDLVVGSGRTEPLLGPGGLSLYSPRVAEPMHHLNQYLRYASVIGRRNTELAILVAAREFDQQFEWTRHENAAREEGVPPAVIDIIRFDLDITGTSPEDTLIIRFGREIFRNHRLSSETFAAAVTLFGRQGAFEIAAVMGDYVMAAVMLHAVDQRLPAVEPPRLPIRAAHPSAEAARPR